MSRGRGMRTRYGRVFGIVWVGGGGGMERSMRFGRGGEGESRGGEACEMVGLDIVG